ncbi:MAG: hypothetical protein AAFO87_06400, partial [Cyanobacteria bacterium J06607_6]
AAERVYSVNQLLRLPFEVSSCVRVCRNFLKGQIKAHLPPAKSASNRQVWTSYSRHSVVLSATAATIKQSFIDRVLSFIDEEAYFL